MPKGSRVGSATGSRQLALDGAQKDGLYDVRKGGLPRVKLYVCHPPGEAPRLEEAAKGSEVGGVILLLDPLIIGFESLC